MHFANISRKRASRRPLSSGAIQHLSSATWMRTNCSFGCRRANGRVCKRNSQAPNDQAHLPGRLSELHTWGSLHAAPVRCSALFGEEIDMRNLASIQVVGQVESIPNADAIERVRV